MKREVFIGVICLVAGLAIGFFGANSLNRGHESLSATQASSNSESVPTQITAGAVDELLKKANEEPQNFAAQMQTGDMYAQIGRFEQAIDFYKRGVLLQPESLEANLVLANALFDAKRFEEAEGYYSKTVKLDEKNVNARIDLGATFVERNAPDHDRAIREFNSALEIDPKSEPAIYYLGIAYLRKGDAETARKKLAELETINAVSPLIGRLRQNIEAPAR